MQIKVIVKRTSNSQFSIQAKTESERKSSNDKETFNTQQSPQNVASNVATLPQGFVVFSGLFFTNASCDCVYVCVCRSCLGQRTAHAGADSQSLSSPNWSPRSSLACNNNNNSNNDIHCKQRPSAITLPQQHRRDWRWERVSCSFQLNLNLSTDIDSNCNQENPKRYICNV